MRVLLVDDDRVFRALMRRALSRTKDLTVVEASTGTEALAALADPPDLAVLDIDMPGTDGISLARRIREMPEFAALPLVFISSSSKADQILELRDLGIRDYLVKPVPLDLLYERLTAVIDAVRPGSRPLSSG